MPATLIHVQYCYDYVTAQIPLELLLYTHVPPAILALLFGGYVLFKVRSQVGLALTAVCAGFAIWCVLDLVSWFVFLGSATVMWAWSLLDLTALLFFAAAYWFLHAFLRGTPPPAWQLIAGLVLILPTALWTALGETLLGYDADTCEALEHVLFTLYPYVVQGIVIVATAALAIVHLRTAKGARQGEVLVASVGVLAFLSFFMASTLAVTILVNETAVEYAYNFEIYGLLGMPVLLGSLGYLIVRYHSFNLRAFGAQVLAIAIIALIASEFAFVTTTANRVLVAVTLVLTASASALLVRSVAREIRQRERIEKLAADLSASNTQLSEFMSLATHEIRNPATFIKGTAANALDGDLGPLSAPVRDAVQKIYVRAGDILHLGSQYLDKSKLELGQLTYDVSPLDLGAIAADLVQEFRPAAEQKGIVLSLSKEGRNYVVQGDAGKLKEVVGNLIDNAIKYTPQGSVTVRLLVTPATVRIEVADTGVGIPAETASRLFEKFSRADAQKANLLGTGLGLYLSKVFVEAHHGRIWVESGGAGTGSKFVVELPASG
jgi:signal transduction histidine kinase